MTTTLILLIIAALVATTMYAIPSLKDALVKSTRALPASTAAVVSTVIDTGTSANGQQPRSVEFLLSAPLVTTAQLPDTKTFTYDILMSDNSDLSSPTVLIDNCIVQTGAGGAGAAAATYRCRLPSNAKRYVGFNVTPSGSGTGDASGATATLDAIF